MVFNWTRHWYLGIRATRHKIDLYISQQKVRELWNCTFWFNHDIQHQFDIRKQQRIRKSPERACFSTNRRVFAATTPCRNNLQIDVEQRHESWFALKRMCPWPPSLGSESKSDGGSAALKSVICLCSLAYLLFYPGAAAAVSAPDDVNISIVCATILNIINGIQDD